MNLLPTINFIKFLLYAILFILAFPMNAQVNIYPFVEDGKIGYKDISDSVVIDPQFDYVEDFKEGYLWTVVGIGEYELLKNDIDRREVKFSGKFGLISHQGEIIFKPDFTIVFKYFPEYAIVGNGSGYLHFDNFPTEKNYIFEGDLGVVNFQGDTILPIEFNRIQPLVSGNRVLWFSGKEGNNYLFTENQQLFIPPATASIEDFKEGLAKIETPSGYGFIDTSGQIVIAPQFEKAGYFKQGKTLVKYHGNYFNINTTGEILDSQEILFDELGPFSEGLARIRIFNEFGYIDADSNFYITPRFEEAGSFFNGITYVSTIDSFGYIHINRKKDLVLKYTFDPIRPEDVIKDCPTEQQILKSFPCENSDSSIFSITFDSLDLGNFISLHLEALRWAPYLYYRYPQMLPKVCAGEGTLAGRFDFNFSFLKTGTQSWELFKREVLFPILENKVLLNLTWDWLKPMYKKVYQSMPEKHQEVYTEMLEYLEGYFSDFPQEDVRYFLTTQPDKFAYQHWDGSTSPYRKVSALIERLIFIHDVLNVDEVKDLIKKIHHEMKGW